MTSTRPNATVLAVILLACAAAGTFLGPCPTGIFHPQTDKATSDDARAETARSSGAHRSSSPFPGVADAEVAPSTSSDDLTRTNAPVREQGRFVGGGDFTSGLALEWATDGELAVAMQPTPEGLFARSAEQWALDLDGLTTEEARKLLPLDDNLPQMPGDLASALGGLPTLEDCQAALRDPAAQRMLEQVLADEATLYALAGAPKGQTKDAGLAEARNLYYASEERLYEHLDTLGSYRNWSVMYRIYRAETK